MIDDPTSASSSTSPGDLRSSASIDGLRRHEKYFLKDDYTLLQVEDKLFRISSRWLDINTPRLAELRRQSAATSPEQPVPIPDVRAAELETLLYFIEESMKDGFSMHTDRWIELLSIAHKLQLHAIKPRVIAEIFKGASPPDPIRQFVLYEAYDVPRSNLTRAMHDLIVRPYALFEAEMAQLSHRTIAEIGGLREDYIRERLRPLGRWPGNAERVARALVACWAASGSGARFRKGGRAML